MRAATLLLAALLAAPAGAATQGDLCAYPSPELVWHDRPTNYSQGPHPVRHPDGSVMVYYDAGQCCHGRRIGTWEGLFALHYPVTGPPNLRPLYGRNNWATTLLRDEYEIAFPRRYGDGLYYAARRWSQIGNPERGSIGLIDPETLAYEWDWWRPGLPPFVAGITPGWIWTNTPSNLTGPRNWRTAVDPTGYPTGDPAPLLQADGSTTPNFSHVAQSADGSYYALAGTWWTRQAIIEWHSPDGLVWAPTGRTWSHPGGLYVYRAAYLTDRHGLIETPGLVMAGTADVWIDTPSARWCLTWWADPGVPLPEQWGTEPPDPPPAPPAPREYVLRDGADPWGDVWTGQVVALCETPPCEIHVDGVLRVHQHRRGLVGLTGLTGSPHYPWGLSRNPPQTLRSATPVRTVTVTLTGGIEYPRAVQVEGRGAVLTRAHEP